MENNVNTEVVENNDEAQQTLPQERYFSQAEVEKFVKKRLERDRATRGKAASEELAEKEKAFAEREQAFTARESRLSCMEYCYQKGYDLDLVDILDTSDTEMFAKKAEKLSTLKMGRQYTAPPASHEPTGSGRDPMAEAFSPDNKHTPKPWPPRFDN